MTDKPRCLGCKKEPHEIAEYIECAEAEDISPAAYVRREEGTYNPRTGAFWCTDCYIGAGQPLGVARSEPGRIRILSEWLLAGGWDPESSEATDVIVHFGQALVASATADLRQQLEHEKELHKLAVAALDATAPVINKYFREAAELRAELDAAWAAQKNIGAITGRELHAEGHNVEPASWSVLVAAVAELRAERDDLSHGCEMLRLDVVELRAELERTRGLLRRRELDHLRDIATARNLARSEALREAVVSRRERDPVWQRIDELAARVVAAVDTEPTYDTLKEQVDAMAAALASARAEERAAALREMAERFRRRGGVVVFCTDVADDIDTLANCRSQAAPAAPMTSTQTGEAQQRKEVQHASGSAPSSPVTAAVPPAPTSGPDRATPEEALAAGQTATTNIHFGAAQPAAEPAPPYELRAAAEAAVRAWWNTGPAPLDDDDVEFIGVRMYKLREALREDPPAAPNGEPPSEPGWQQEREAVWRAIDALGHLAWQRREDDSSVVVLHAHIRDAFATFSRATMGIDPPPPNPGEPAK